MKKIKKQLLLSALIVIVFFFQSCLKLKDTCRHDYTYSYYVPVYKTKEVVRDAIKSDSAEAIINPGKIFIIGKYIFLNEKDKGIHIIDNSNPSSPQNIAFINIPGNMDIVVKGNTLYADMYTDLVAIDISNPLNVVRKKVIEGVFPNRYWEGGFTADSSMVIVNWLLRDTTISIDCNSNRMYPVYSTGVFYVEDNAASTSGAAVSISPVGKGGSMARFTLLNERLYAVNNSSLDVFNVTAANDPVYTKNVMVANNIIQTIFPYKNNLFIGSSVGMFIYSVDDPDNPVDKGQFGHVQSCDPVIADDNYAYVTLHSGDMCGSTNNELDVLNINDLNDPSLLKTYSLTNPQGLSKDDRWLFICDGAEGLKVFDAADVNNLQLKKQIALPETFDVITNEHIALVIAKDGLYQYDYTDINNIQFLSKIATANP